MTIDIIKNVLTRIMTINQNLTEESLKNLLIASSWDEMDIKEGLNVFNSFKSGIKPDEYKPITAQPDTLVKETKVEEESADEKKDIKAEPVNPKDFVFPYNKENKDNHNAINLIKTNIKDPEVVKSEKDKPEDKKEEVEKLEEVKEEDKNDSKNKIKINLFELDPEYDIKDGVMPDELIEEVVKEHTYHKRPFGLIVLDAVLFLVVVMLIFYILLI